MYLSGAHIQRQRDNRTKSNKSHEHTKIVNEKYMQTNKLNANSSVFICRSFELHDMIVEMSQII